MRRFDIRLLAAVVLMLSAGVSRAQSLADSYIVRSSFDNPWYTTNLAVANCPTSAMIYPAHPRVSSNDYPFNLDENGNSSSNSYRLIQSLVGTPYVGKDATLHVGQALPSPSAAELTIGGTIYEVDWAAMSYDSILSSNGVYRMAFYEPSQHAIYAVQGGDVTVLWQLRSGTNTTSIEVTYAVSGTPDERPFRIYWTENPHKAPVVNLSKRHVKFYWNAQIHPEYEGVVSVTNSVGMNSPSGYGNITNELVAGLWFDETGMLHANGQVGRVVMQYFETGNYDQQVPGGVVIVEVARPEVVTLPAFIGEPLTAQTSPYGRASLGPRVTAGTSDERPYAYQHAGQYSYSPKDKMIFPVQRTVDEPWKIEVYWMEGDLMGTAWPYEADWYAADWNPSLPYYVRSSEPGHTEDAPLTIPTVFATELMDYQDPAGVASLSGTRLYMNGEGRALLKLTAGDNIWFQAIQSVDRQNPMFDVVPKTWTIPEKIVPHASSIGIQFSEQNNAYLLPSRPVTLGSNFTMELWAKIGKPASFVTNDYSVWWMKGTAGQELSLSVDGTGSWNVVCSAAGGIPSTNFASSRLKTYFAAGQWTHLVVSMKERTNLQFYVDGTLMGSSVWLAGTNTVGGAMTGAFDVVFGSVVRPGLSLPFDGSFDEIRLWASALPTNQFAMPRGAVMTSTNSLHLYYPVDDVPGDVVNDASSSTNDGIARRAFMREEPGAVGLMNRESMDEDYGFIYEPAGTLYNTDLYNFDPNAETDSARPIFAVNALTGRHVLEVWWPSIIQQADMPEPLRVFAWKQVYSNVWPDKAEQIVLASQKGSAGKQVQNLYDGSLRFPGGSGDGATTEDAGPMLASLSTYTLDAWVKPGTSQSASAWIMGFAENQDMPDDDKVKIPLVSLRPAVADLVEPAPASAITWQNRGSLGGTFIELAQGGGAFYGIVTNIGGVRCLQFNGNILSSSVTSPASITGSNVSFTVTAWANTEWADPLGTLVAWAPHTGPSGSAAELNYGSSSSQGAFGNFGQGAAYSTLPAENKWHHLAATYSATSLKIYVDGVLSTQKVLSGVNILAGGKFALGNVFTNAANTAWGGAQGFYGYLAGVDVYNSVISSNGISALAKEFNESDLLALTLSPDNKPTLYTARNGVTNYPLQAPQALTSQAWTHVAFTFVTNLGRLYVDGSLVASASLSGKMPTLTDAMNVFIGGNPRSESLSGNLLGVRIWDGAMPESEVRRVRLLRAAPREPGVLACWPCQDGAGGSVQEIRGGIDALRGAGVWSSDRPIPILTNDSGTVFYTIVAPKVYYENSSSANGYNPNEEHGLVFGEAGGNVAFAIRDDLNLTNSSKPFVLVQYTDDEGDARMHAFQVVRTNSAYPLFESTMVAGNIVAGPHPLDFLPDPNTDRTYQAVTNGPGWRDRKLVWWGRHAADDGGVTNLVMHNYYPNQDGFAYPGWIAQPKLRQPIAWLPSLPSDTNSRPIGYTWKVSWPTDLPVMDIGQTLLEPIYGLPDIYNQKSIEILYEQPRTVGTNRLADAVTLLDPTIVRSVPLSGAITDYGFTFGGPATIYNRNGFTWFYNLAPDLSERFYYDPTAPSAPLRLIGQFVKSAAGADYLLVNVLTTEQRNQIKSLVSSSHTRYSEWSTAVDSLAVGPVVVTNRNQPIDHAALLANGRGYGYVSLMFNDATNVLTGVQIGDAITMQIIKVSTNLYNGELIPLTDPRNLLSQQMNMLFSETFGGAGGEFEFQWRSSLPNANGTVPSDPDSYAVYRQESGLTRVTLGEQGSTLQDLVDRYFVLRYRATTNAPCYLITGDRWSDYTPKGFAPGWLNRVLTSITPFTQRMTDLYENPVETRATMIQSAGAPYEGDVALNMDNINNVGLIQLYETLLNAARKLSVDIGIDNLAANQQLLLAATRLNDLYMLLGNEAYADALNPTIGFGENTAGDFGVSVDYGQLSGSLFCFDNQCASLLEEELGLLRGRGDTNLSPPLTTSPYYNRLPWNFTHDNIGGEVAYAVNYNIVDVGTATINEETAANLFPQGHGDAFGHYLSSLSCYYKLLRHPSYTWGDPAIGAVLLGTHPISVDYYDEQKFARSAASLVRTGRAILDRTYREAYRDDGEAFANYRDSIPSRAWGAGDWAQRVGVGGLYNWAAVNSMVKNGRYEVERALAFSGTASNPLTVNLVAVAAPAFQLSMNFTAYRASTNSTLFRLDDGAQQARELQIDSQGYLAWGDTGNLLSTNRVNDGVEHSITIEGLTNGLGAQSLSWILDAGTEQSASNVTPVLAGDAVLGSLRFTGVIHDVSFVQSGVSNVMFTFDSDTESYSDETSIDDAQTISSALIGGGVAWMDVVVGIESNETLYSDEGILEIDRNSIGALLEIGDAYKDVQKFVDGIDRGMNPLGLSRDAVVFDISPAGIDDGDSHFEQIAVRAENAINNASILLERAQQASTLMREQYDGLQNVTDTLLRMENDYTAQLIEIFGYPYSDDIGPGKTFVQGYNGPDLFHYNYIDLAQYGLNEFAAATTLTVNVKISTFEMLNRSFSAPASSNNVYQFEALSPVTYTNPSVRLKTNDIATVQFTFANNGMLAKPASWSGRRRAQGRIQESFAAIVEEYIVLKQLKHGYQQKLELLQFEVNRYNVSYGPDAASKIKFVNTKTQEQTDAARELALRQYQAVAIQGILDRLISTFESAMAAADMEVIVGTANGGDGLSKPAIIGLSVGYLAVSFAMQGAAIDMERQAFNAERDMTISGLELDAEMTKRDLMLADYDVIYQMRQMLAETDTISFDIQACVARLDQAQQAYFSAVAEGERLLSLRESDRTYAANVFVQGRYNDMLFRIYRDSALQQYQSALDLASKYVYLAARAYDFETALLPSGSGSDTAVDFYQRIFNAKTVGLITEGPGGFEVRLGTGIGDPGLASPLAELKENWSVLDGRLGFNNPQTEMNKVSLRNELFRVLSGEEGDARWRERLEECKVDNLLDIDEFQRYCLPMESQSGLQSREPGLVIPFSTTINFAENIFGHDLAGGDHAFDSSRFATKIRAAGIWFSSYNEISNSVLSATPRVYLIPVGLDAQRSPVDGSIREWRIVDQALPVPFDIGTSLPDEDWIPIVDSLDGDFAAIRQFSSFRAYPDDGDEDESEYSFDSRLIGRSVWNTRWLLIIPAGSLSSDRDKALDQFINGSNGDGNGVSDIRIEFLTYSHAGN